jgi:hypothetical protein
MRTVYIVIDKLLTEEDSWETNLTSLLQGYVEASAISNFKIEEVHDTIKVKSLFETKTVKPKDIFIFTNAWTASIQYIKHWSESYKTPVTMLGFWSKGCFINSDPEFRPLNDRSWRKLHETTNMKCLDKSFFLNDWYKNQFQNEISRGTNSDKLQICKFPLDYLSLELSLIKDSYYKKNMVIFPWRNYNSLHEQIVYDFIRVFKKSQVIFAQENSPMQRTPLIHQMSKAKVAFLPYTHPNIGQEIYECFLLEIIPIVPDIDGFKELVPKEFRYPPEWTESIFNYCKFAPDLTGKIQTMLDSYEELKPLLLQHQERLTEHYFDSEQIIKEIFD